MMTCAGDDLVTIREPAKVFYRRWDFREMPGQPMRLFLTAGLLDALMAGEKEE
jgi:hypothetical protein